MAIVPASCDFCNSSMHTTNTCPAQDTQDVSAMYSNQRPPYQKWDPYSNTYNPGMRDHPNFSWRGGEGMQGQGRQAYVPPHLKASSNHQASSSSSNEGDLAAFMKQVMGKFEKLEASMGETHQIKDVVAGLVKTQGEVDAKRGGLPSNVVINPK